MGVHYRLEHQTPITFSLCGDNPQFSAFHQLSRLVQPFEENDELPIFAVHLEKDKTL